MASLKCVIWCVEGAAEWVLFRVLFRVLNDSVLTSGLSDRINSLVL